MFSGLVREIAQVKSFTRNTLEILTPQKANIGDSIAINGACLTAVYTFSDGVAMELSEHTKQTIAIENYTKGARVHLEPALKLGDGLDGHIVQGHIDGVGTITRIEHQDSQSIFWVESTEEILSYMIPKGSVCVEGISLTITESNPKSFCLTLIPHTLKNTLFGQFKVGRKVNIETDVITRSVVSTLKHIMNTKPSVRWQDIDSMQLGF